jgi:hypothetical protein
MPVGESDQIIVQTLALARKCCTRGDYETAHTLFVSLDMLSFECAARIKATKARELQDYGLWWMAAGVAVFVVAHILVLWAHIFVSWPRHDYVCLLNAQSWTGGLLAVFQPSKFAILPASFALLLGCECPLAALGLAGFATSRKGGPRAPFVTYIFSCLTGNCQRFHRPFVTSQRFHMPKPTRGEWAFWTVAPILVECGWSCGGGAWLSSAVLLLLLTVAVLVSAGLVCRYYDK